MSTSERRGAGEIDREIGARIRARRNELGCSQSYVADIIGITTQQMQKYESGENRVAAATLLRIAEVLRVEAGSLLPGGPARRARGERVGSDDQLGKQLLSAFARIESPGDKRLVLTMARRLAGASRTGRAAKSRRT